MKCSRCGGRSLLDRVFSDNMSFEVACIHCGDRKYINKHSELGEWLTVQETKRERLRSGLF